MKIIPINLEDVDAYSCVDVVISGICDWKNIDYKMMFAESWGFSYKRDMEEKLFSERFNTEKGNKIKLLKEYHGIEVKHHDFNGEETYAVIEQELNSGRPVAILMDIFWCPWFFEEYKKHNAMHYMLVTGINEETKELYIVDAQMAKDGKLLSKDHFMQGCESYTIYGFGESEKDINVKEILENAVIRILDESKHIDMFSDIEKFSNDIVNNIDLKNEIKGYENSPLLAPIFEKIRNVGTGRRQFAVTLSHMAEKTNMKELNIIAEMLNESGNKWVSVFGILAKSYFMKNSEKVIKKLGDKIKEIGLLEKQIFRNIIGLIEGRQLEFIEQQHCSEYNLNFKEYEYINLNNQFNNRGMGLDVSNECDAELSNPGRYFCIKETPENWIVKKENMEFDISAVEKGQNDNISCDGQEINVDCNEYTHIMFLGCGELGNHLEKIEVVYEDGTVENVDVKFTSWLSPDPVFAEKIAMEGIGVLKDESSANTYPFAVNIFAQCKKLKYRKCIKKLKMPNCNNMHVFGITLAK